MIRLLPKFYIDFISIATIKDDWHFIYYFLVLWIYEESAFSDVWCSYETVTHKAKHDLYLRSRVADRSTMLIVNRAVKNVRASLCQLTAALVGWVKYCVDMQRVDHVISDSMAPPVPTCPTATVCSRPLVGSEDGRMCTYRPLSQVSVVDM